MTEAARNSEVLDTEVVCSSKNPAGVACLHGDATNLAKISSESAFATTSPAKFYHKIHIRNAPDLFTWHFSSKIPLGARVFVQFRGKKSIGIVVAYSSEISNFKTQKIIEIIDQKFIPLEYIRLAEAVSRENFCKIGKVLNLMIPEKFFIKKTPENREIFIEIGVGDSSKIRGTKQKLAIELVRASGSFLLESLRKKIPLKTIKTLLERKIFTKKFGKIAVSAKKIQISDSKFQKLSFEQESALEKIEKSRKPVLLFGVTGSGKTEIYKNLTKTRKNRQILLLVPEIALTPQLVENFRPIFGDRIAIWHSKMSDGERVREWARCRSGEAEMLIGARSAVLVPLPNLGQIIIDEEHEWTFKNEFSPRFWCQDLAMILAKNFRAKIVFGSATPRLESFENCEQKIWTRVDLPNRIFDTKLPKIQIVNLQSEAKKGNRSPVSESLAVEISKILRRKKQAVIFLNKRGFAGATICKFCGRSFHCKNCDSNMKFHQKSVLDHGKFCCHVCGNLENFPKKCPDCDSFDFRFRGWGTQMVERVLAEKFPGIRTLRADADAVSGKKDFENLMQKFHAREADILLGTQMIAKGLDFENVELAGVILADVGLTLPDFRAEERVFQILTQISGRAGRRSRQGKVIIQTFRPDEKIFEFCQHHAVENFLKSQKIERKKAKMPPFSSIAKITFSDFEKSVAFSRAKKFHKFCEKKFVIFDKKNSRESHLAPAFFPKTHKKYHFHVILRAEKKSDLVNFLEKVKFASGAKIDIDPASLL